MQNDNEAKMMRKKKEKKGKENCSLVCQECTKQI